MRLVNPPGRDVTTFTTEVNRCACKCSEDWAATFNRADDSTCACQCLPWSSSNANANSSSAYTAVENS